VDKMKNYWIFGLVFLICLASAMALPEPSYPYVNSTTNATVSLLQVNWTGNITANLSCYIFQTDNSGTSTNDSGTCWAADTTADWSQNIITLNATPGMVVNWKVYANDSGDEWNTYSSSITITYAYLPLFRTLSCPVDNLQTTVMYIFIGLLILGFVIFAE
jgi:hypothetical protein